MACKHCNSKNKLVRTIGWAVYLAPLAYSAYVLLKDMGVVDKITETSQPYVDATSEKAQEYYEVVKDTVASAYATVTDTAVGTTDKV